MRHPLPVDTQLPPVPTDGEGMPPKGTRYPAVLQAVMNHAERLRGFLLERERKVRVGDPGASWIIGRAGEVQCVVALIALDWYEERYTGQEAAIRLSRYVREIHDGLAMHLDIAMPPCCKLRLARASLQPPAGPPVVLLPGATKG
jgi:hypothetical protein